MNLEVRTLQLGKNSWVLPFAEEYQKKISFFHKISFKTIKSEKDLLKGIEPRDWLLICDEKGQSPSSHQFANNLQKVLESGKQNGYFLIGGPFGLDEEIKKRADQSVRLSNLVMNQEIALAVLFEQIFRGFSILNNHPYHNP